MQQPTPGNKLDGRLGAAYRAWTENPDIDPDAAMGITLTFEGDLAPIEALGFETYTVSGNQAMGAVHFRDLPKLIAHPNVRRMAAGQRPKKHLDTAVRDILARASAPLTGAPVDGLWHADKSTGALTSVPKGTGKNVIVAIIDTGIDVTHPMFLSQLKPTKKTRILKIWDQGLTPKTFAQCPDVALLESPKTYGVEYDSTAIETHLNGGAKIDHKDCDGHGTHVAGIAAGGTVFPAVVGNADFVGVAPEADIIVVKYIDNPEGISYRKTDASKDGPVPDDLLFRDAVMWCLRTAKNIKPNAKPVVINMSFGDDSYPGDGLDPNAHWCDERMDPGQPAGNSNFPKGAVLVKSAGNEGDINERRVARIKIPHIAELIVPLVLDDSSTNRSHSDAWNECKRTTHSPSLDVYFWYRVVTGQSITFAVKTPKGAHYSSDVALGSRLEVGFKPKTGSAANDTIVPFTTKVDRFTVVHEDIPAVPHPAGGTVQRARCHFFLDPKVSGKTVTYYSGIYEILIKAPMDTELFLMCGQESWDNEALNFQVSDVEQGGTHITPLEIKITEKSSMMDPLGKHALTVAAYDDKDGKTTDPKFQEIGFFSSRGPLRDFSDPAAPKGSFDKPDIAAPGMKIKSAQSADGDSKVLKATPMFKLGNRFEDLSGTSMSAPMITGAVALLLQKKGDLSTSDVRTHLSAVARNAVSPSVPPDSKDAYGSGMVDALASHNRLP